MCSRTQRPHRDWARTGFECPLQRYGSAVDCCRGRGSACNRPGYGIRPLGGVTINPTIELPELKQDQGNRLLESTNKTLCLPGTRRKEEWPHKRLTHSCLWVSRSLQRRRASAVACCVNWIKDLLSMAPPIRTRPSFPLSQYLPLKGCCSTTQDPVFLASGGEEFNTGPETRLDLSELLCNKVLLKYKRDRESFWHRHQKGAERVPPR